MTIEPTPAAAATSRRPRTPSRSFTSGVYEPSTLRSLERALPPLEQRLELVAGPAVGGQRLDVAPVLGEPALQLGDGRFPLCDLVLDPVELGRPRRLRLRPRRRRRLLLPRLRLRWSRRLAELVPSADVVGPAAVVRDDPSILDRKRAFGDGVEDGAVMGDEQHGPGERLEGGLECLAAALEAFPG